MALRCDYCHKGIGYGHAVSHAKNRVGRIFRPNLQKLKVLKNGITLRVKFCTRCIKRLKKDSRLGQYSILSLVPVQQAEDIDTLLKKAGVTPAKTVKKTESEKMKLEAIVGKKS